MNVYGIKRMWLRRALIIVFVPIMAPIVILCDIFDPVEQYLRHEFADDFREWCRLIRGAWQDRT
jgi:hypothetical protein